MTPDDEAARLTEDDPYATRVPSPGSLEDLGVASEGASSTENARGWAVVTRDVFERSLTECGFLDARELGAILEDLALDGGPTEVEDLARALIKLRKLTRYQASALYQGKARSLSIGPYVVLDKLGSGGMGIVFKVRKREGGPDLALKLLPPSASKHPTSVLRFRREAEIMQKLDHPNIVSSHDIGEYNGVHYLVMDFIEGRDLDKVVRTGGPMRVPRAVDCIIQAARGLAAAHDRGIIHRDIKPSNLLLDNLGIVRVLDLGLARIGAAEEAWKGGGRGKDSDLTASGIIMGTADFLSPEQSDDSKRADHRADIYSLGCTLHYLLAGRPPYVADSVMQRIIAHHQKPIPSLLEARSDVNPEVDEVFRKMMAKTPEARQQSMLEVVEGLEVALKSLAGSKGLRVFDDSGPRPSTSDGSKVGAAPSSVEDRKPPGETESDGLLTFIRSELFEPDAGLTAPDLPPVLLRRSSKGRTAREWTGLAVKGLVAAAALVVLIRFFPGGAPPRPPAPAGAAEVAPPEAPAVPRLAEAPTPEVAPAPWGSGGDRRPDPGRPAGPPPREAKPKLAGEIGLQLLLRRGDRDEARREAVADLAKIEAKPEVLVLLEAIKALDDRPGEGDDGVAQDLGRILTARDPAELSEHLWSFEGLTKVGKKSITRRLGFLALIAAGRLDGAWTLAVKDVRALRDLVEAMPAVRDPAARASLYPRVLPLLEGLPKGLGWGSKVSREIEGRFVRVELRGLRPLTLAEVEVFSDGRNVGPLGKATEQDATADGGAERALDGNKSPYFGDGGQTHTGGKLPNPWWEVDLGALYPIDSIVVYNRGEGLGQRLDGYTLKVLDAARRVAFEINNLPAKPVAATEVGGTDPEGPVRRSAMLALASVRGQGPETFRALARFVRGAGPDRTAAIRAIGRIPVADWPVDEAQPTLNALVAYIKTIPPRYRTSSSRFDALALADGLARLLPADRASTIRLDLGELGVRVIRLGVVTDRMRFDADRIAAQAGKPVEVLFENTDIMPHNFVVTRPGALEEVGFLGESTGTQPEAPGRDYVPTTDRIVVASRLLAPGDSQKVGFTAPKRPGVYPYVCTYPGQWRRMYGAIYVVDDLAGYLADPPRYLAAHPLPILDDLLTNNRPRGE